MVDVFSVGRETVNTNISALSYGTSNRFSGFHHSQESSDSGNNTGKGRLAAL